MRYKALLLDYDGTTVRSAVGLPQEPVVSERVSAALKSIRNRVKIGFCTGRKFYDLSTLVDELDLQGPHICCAGAQLVEKGGKIVWEKLIEPKLAKNVFKYFANKGKIVHIKKGQYHYVPNKKFNEVKAIWGKRFFFKPASELIGWHVPMMVAVNVDDEDIAYLEGKDLHTTKQESTKEGVWFADVTAHGVNKQEGILQWLRHTGLKREEVVGVGDGYNDIPMLNAVGLKIAMGNGVEDVKVMADLVCPGVDEDGVATVVEKFF